MFGAKGPRRPRELAILRVLRDATGPLSAGQISQALPDCYRSTAWSGSPAAVSSVLHVLVMTHQGLVAHQRGKGGLEYSLTAKGFASLAEEESP